jgi:PDZ domain
MDNDDPLDDALTDLLGSHRVAIADEDRTYRRVVERAHRRIVGRRVARAALATAVVATIATAAAVTSAHHTAEVQVRAPLPATIGRAKATRECPITGVAPNGKTYGTVPDDPTGRAKTPDYIAVKPQNGGTAGYLNKADMLRQGPQSLPVYACDLTTVVGHLVSGIGFVPLPGTSPPPEPPPVTRGLLGVQIADPGPVVIQASGPAARVGLTPGDVIVSINNTTINSASALSAALAHSRPGDKIRISWNDTRGQEHTATVQLAAQHAPAAVPTQIPPGVSVEHEATGVVIRDQTHLTIVAGCDGSSVRVDETGTEVRVRVAYADPPTSLCPPQLLPATLHSPLGARRIVDATGVTLLLVDQDDRCTPIRVNGRCDGIVSGVVPGRQP